MISLCFFLSGLFGGLAIGSWCNYKMGFQKGYIDGWTESATSKSFKEPEL